MQSFLLNFFPLIDENRILNLVIHFVGKKKQKEKKKDDFEYQKEYSYAPEHIRFNLFDSFQTRLLGLSRIVN